MATPYQFLMLTGTPEKEAAFRQSKREFGSHYAFHGSGMGALPFPLCHGDH
jgi:hypothetical protein